MSRLARLAAVFVCASLLAGAAAAQRPNVVFIMTDDLGYGDLSAYGGTDIDTPTLDSIAAQGVRFTDFYANAPNCSATRAGFLTRRYQQRYGIASWLTHRAAPKGEGVAAAGKTLPHPLETAG